MPASTTEPTTTPTTTPTTAPCFIPSGARNSWRVLAIAAGLLAGLGATAHASLYSDSTAIFRFDATLCLLEDVPVHAAPLAGSPVLFHLTSGTPPRQIHVYGATPDEAWAEIYENQTLGYIPAGALELEGCWTPASQPAGPTLYDQLPEEQWP